MRFEKQRGSTSNKVRVFIPDNTSTIGGGLTGLTSSSTNLAISYARYNDAAATQYTGANIETITTIGTYATPSTSSKVRFKAVDATNFPGLYELQFHDSATIFGAADTSESVIINILELTTTALHIGPNMTLIPLVPWNPQDLTNMGLTNLDAAISTRAAASTAISNVQWTNARATNLDYLDAAVSSRAAASTALSNVQWTNTRAGNLDHLDADISSRSSYAGGDTAGTTTLLSRLTSTRATYLDNLSTGPVMTTGDFPPNFEILEINSSGHIAYVEITNVLNINTDKNGYALNSGGLDSISLSAPAGVAGNFREMMIQIWRRFFKTVHKNQDTLTIKTFADNGTTVMTTQNYTDSGGTQTMDAAT